MSTDNYWNLLPEPLAASLARWHKTNPDQTSRDLVNNGLMDLITDPLHWGTEDDVSPGVFHKRIDEANVGVIYAVFPDSGGIAVTDIATVPV